MNAKVDVLNREYTVGNLSKKNKSELLDLLQRQNRILNNSKLLALLPDKGAKINKLKDQIEQALTVVQKQDELSTLFQRMELTHNENHFNHNLSLDSDDDDITCEKSKVLPSEATAANHRDSATETIPNNDSPTNLNDVNKDTKRLIDKIMDRQIKENFQPKIHFVPNRNTHSKESEEPEKKVSKSNKLWIETAVTPPPNKFTQAKQLSIAESVELLQQNQKKLQDLALEKAMESLCSRVGLHMDEPSTSTDAFLLYPLTASSRYREEEHDSESDGESVVHVST